MHSRVTLSIVPAAAVALLAMSSAGDLPAGYMPQSQSDGILAKTLHVRLDPDLSGLSPAELGVVDKLMRVGLIFQRLYENSRHPQAGEAYDELLALDKRLGSPKATQNLITLYYLFKGPIARTLDNARVPFLPVAGRDPGGSLYPPGLKRAELDAFIDRHPQDRAALLGLRTVVRRAGAEQAAADIAVLDTYSALDVLHPGLREELETAASRDDNSAFYAVPYSVAFAEPLMAAYALLMEAADGIDAEDSEFAGYLRNRARDLLSDNYESGDASWVTGHFKNLNAQIGSYEVYDDELYGVKTFFGLNVLLRDRAESEALRRAIKGMQAFENSLPYEPEGYEGGDKKPVREDIPVGVYNVVADFGQSRGTNTATILPNESEYARKYGRTILLRANIMRDPDLFEIRKTSFDAAVRADIAGDLVVDGGFHRTLWHEIGHYLGPDRTRDGRDLGDALLSAANVLEELKADLVSLFLCDQLVENGYYTDEQRHAVYASGVRRVLLKSEPKRSQVYQTMELMQVNYYLEKGLLEFDKKAKRLVIHYDRYHDVVADMLADVLSLQYDGDLDAADAFIDQYTGWDKGVQGRLAESMKRTEVYRYAYVTYGALDSLRP
jgi:hypothetical protein